MALFEVILDQRFQGQQLLNRWNYTSEAAAASVSASFALTSAMGFIWDNTAIPPGYPPGSVFATLRACQSTVLTYVQVTTLNVYDPTDFYQTPFLSNNAGGSGGSPMSPAVTYSLRSNVVRRDIRRGRKAIGGVNEQWVGDGGVIVPEFLATLNYCASVMSAPVVYDDEGNTLTFTPVIVSKEEYDPNPTNPNGNHRAYRYYPTLAEQSEHLAVGIQWAAISTMRTQRSRQYDNGS